MGDKTEYRQYNDKNKKPPKPNWYMREALGAISLAGIGAVAWKMRGPTGKLLDRIKNHDLEALSVKAYAKYARDGFSDLSHPRDLQGKIAYSQGKDLPDKIIKPSTVMGIDEMNAAMAKHYGENGLTDTSIINSTRRLETDLEAFFSGDEGGASIDRLKQLDIFRKHNYDFSRAKHMPETPTSMVLSKLRLETIKEHDRKKFQYIQGMPDFDATDPVINEDPFANRDKIAKYHRFMMENDQQYAKSYRGALNSTIKSVGSDTTARVISNPLTAHQIMDNATEAGYRSNARLTSKKFGSTDDQIRGFTDLNISTAGEGSLLYRGSNEKFLSNEVVEKKVSDALNNKQLKLKYDKYSPQIKKIGRRLEELKMAHPNDIVDVYIEDRAHTVGDKVSRSYLNIGIELQGKKKVVLPIPVEDNGIVPNIRSIQGRVKANVQHLIFNPLMNEEVTSVNSTQLYLEEAYRILTSSTMNDLFDEPDTAGFEKKIIARLAAVQDRETPLQGEFRDFFRAHQYRVHHIEQMLNATSGTKASRIQDLKVGRQGLANILKFKRSGNDHMVLALDLETLNIDTPSPQYHPGDARTKIWQYGMVEMDGQGRVTDVKEISSNHIFKEEDILTTEHVNSGKLRQIYNEKTKRGDRLRKFSGYTKKTMNVSDGYDSLLAYKDMIDRKSGTSNKYIKDTTNPIRNTKDFAALIRREIRAFRAKAKRAGKQPLIVTANGQKFDLALLSNILGDPSIMRWGDTVDIQSVQRMLTIGHYDAPSMNVDNLLSYHMSKRGLGTKNIVSPKEGMWDMVDAMSQGKVVRNGISGYSTLKKMLQGTLGDKDVALHNSAGMDSVYTLGIFNSLKNFKEDSSYDILNRADQFINYAEGATTNDIAKSFLKLEGMRVGDVHLSFGLQSSNSASKKILSGINISHMYPFLGLNPGNKDLHQIARNMFVKSNSKNKQTAKWRRFNPFQSVNEVRMEEWMHKNATWDMNQYANELQFNTVYTIGKLGGTPGYIGMTDDALDFTAVLNKMVGLEDMPADAVLNNQLTDMYREIMKRAKKLSSFKGESLSTGGGEVSAATWAEASIMVRRAMDRGSLESPILDGNNPIQTWVEEGGERRRINIGLPGKVRSITQDSSPGSDKGSAKFFAEVMFEARGQNLEGMLLNHGGTKSSISRLGVKSADIAGGRWGLHGDIDLIMNWDFLDKKYWGSLKQSMLRKAVGLNAWRMDPKNGETVAVRNEAKSSMKYIVGKLNEHIPTTMSPNGSVRFGYAGFTQDPKNIVKAVSNITFDEIFKMASTVGHEYTWNRKTIEMYYGYHGDGDVIKGRTKVKKEIDLLLKDKTYNTRNSIESLKMSREQESIMEHMDPFRILETRHRGKLEGGSMDTHWKTLTPKQKDDLLAKARLGIMTQIVPDSTNVGSPGVVGMFAGMQSSTVYGHGQGRENITNTLVKFQRSYFDQIMIDGNHFSPGFKNMLSGSSGAVKKPKWAHTAKKFTHTIQTLVNNDLSSIITKKQGITLDEVDVILARQETIKAVERDIQQLEVVGSDISIDKIDRSLDEIADITSTGSPDEVREILDTVNIKNSKQRLEAIKKSDNWIHVKDVKQLSMLATRKDNAIFLPARVRKSDGDKLEMFGERFEFIIEDEIGRLSGNTKSNPLNAEAMASTLKMIKEAQTAEGFDPKNAMFDIIEVDGKHKVSMAGFVLPADSYGENIAHHLADGEEYVVKSDGSKMITQTLAAYKSYADEWRGARDPYRLKTKSTNVAVAWMKTWANMGVDKNSPWFKANGMHYLDGFQAMFHSADSVIAEASDMLDNFDNGKNVKLTRWLGANKGISRSEARTVLSNVADMKINTVLGMSESLFSGDRVANLASGGSVKLGDMFDQAQGELATFISQIKMGRATMPGGAILRNPIPAAGKHPAFMTNFLGLPEAYGSLLGVDKNQVYMSEVLANSIKADNDGDIVMAIMRNFSTIEEANKLSEEGRASLGNLLNDTAVSKTYLDNFDAQNNIGGTVMRGGVMYAKLARVDRSSGGGGIIFEERKLSEIDYVTKKGDKLGGYLANFADEAFATTASLKHYGAGSTRAMERHMSTIALNAYSKTMIGLWSNTMRTRIHEVFQANPGLSKNSTAIFEMLGSLDHGMAGMQQQAIAFAKHGMASKVYEMADHLKVWQNPRDANVEQYKAAKRMWVDATPEHLKKTAPNAFDFILDNSVRLSIAKQYDPKAAKFMKHELSNLMGTKDYDFGQMIQYHMQEKGLVDNKLVSSMTDAMDQYYGQSIAKYRGEDVPLRMNQFVSDLLDEGMTDPLTKNLNKRYGNTMVKMRPQFKSMGKWAGIGALAYLGLNFFRPNQLSGGVSDGFIDLGTDINGSNVNSINSDLQLDRRHPLDMVNASFSKKAFIEMNNIGNTVKSGKSNYIMELLKGNTMKKQYVNFRSRGRPQTSYTSLKSGFGKFGTADHERRSRLVRG